MHEEVMDRDRKNKEEDRRKEEGQEEEIHREKLLETSGEIGNWI